MYVVQFKQSLIIQPNALIACICVVYDHDFNRAHSVVFNGRTVGQ